MHVFEDVRSLVAVRKRGCFGHLGGPVPPMWWFSASRQRRGLPTNKIAQPRIAKLGARSCLLFATVAHLVRRQLPASLPSRSGWPQPLDRLYLLLRPCQVAEPEHRRPWWSYPELSAARLFPAFPPAPSCRRPVVPGSGCASPAERRPRPPLACQQRIHSSCSQRRSR